MKCQDCGHQWIPRAGDRLDREQCPACGSHRVTG